MYLIDTSVWNNFLRGKADQEVELLTGLLEDGSAYLCEVTFAEICFGARDKKQFKQYEERFSEMSFWSSPMVGTQGQRRWGLALEGPASSRFWPIL